MVGEVSGKSPAPSLNGIYKTQSAASSSTSFSSASSGKSSKKPGALGTKSGFGSMLSLSSFHMSPDKHKQAAADHRFFSEDKPTSGQPNDYIEHGIHKAKANFHEWRADVASGDRQGIRGSLKQFFSRDPASKARSAARMDKYNNYGS